MIHMWMWCAAFAILICGFAYTIADWYKFKKEEERKYEAAVDFMNRQARIRVRRWRDSASDPELQKKYSKILEGLK